MNDKPDMQYRNPTFYKAVRAYVLAVFQLISKRVEASPREVSKVSISSEELSGLPEYQRCAEVMTTDPIVRSHLNRFVGTSVMGGGYYSAPELLETIMLPGEYPADAAFNDEQFRLFYVMLEDVLDRDRIRCEALAPLQGVFSDIPAIKLAADLEISQLTAEEERQVHVLDVVRRQGGRWSDRLYAVRAKYELPKVIVADQADIPEQEKSAAYAKQSDITERIEETIHILRAFRSGNLHYGGVVHRAYAGPFSGAINISGKALETVFGMPYALDAVEDVVALKDFRDDVQSAKAKGHKFLSTVIRRFSYGCERRRVEDKIIDFMIAAEALSQAGSSRGSKGEQIAQYVSSLVPVSEQQKVKTHMRDSYRLRNSIVHEGDITPWLVDQGMSLPDLHYFVAVTEAHLRDALRRTVSDYA